MNVPRSLRGPDRREHVARCTPHVERLHAEGAVMIPLRGAGERHFSQRRQQTVTAAGKEPTQTGWQRAERQPLDAVLSWIDRGCNYAIVPGACGRAVLDVEPAGLALWPLERLPQDALRVRTPSGGFQLHLDLLATEALFGHEITKRVLGIEAELFARQGYVVGPGCYAWSKKGGRADVYDAESIGPPIRDEELLRRILDPFLRSKDELARPRGRRKRHVVDPPRAGVATPYGLAALRGELETMAGLPPRRTSAFLLSRCASAIGSLVAAGELPESLALEEIDLVLSTHFRGCARTCPRAVAKGFAFGLAHPRQRRPALG